MSNYSNTTLRLKLDHIDSDRTFAGWLNTAVQPVYLDESWPSYQAALRLARLGLCRFTEDGACEPVRGFAR